MKEHEFVNKEDEELSRQFPEAWPRLKAAMEDLGLDYLEDNNPRAWWDGDPGEACMTVTVREPEVFVGAEMFAIFQDLDEDEAEHYLETLREECEILASRKKVDFDWEDDDGALHVHVYRKFHLNKWTLKQFEEAQEATAAVTSALLPKSDELLDQ